MFGRATITLGIGPHSSYHYLMKKVMSQLTNISHSISHSLPHTMAEKQLAQIWCEEIVSLSLIMYLFK